MYAVRAGCTCVLGGGMQRARFKLEDRPSPPDRTRTRSAPEVNAMCHFLSQVDYEGKDPVVEGPPDPALVIRGRDAKGD